MRCPFCGHHDTQVVETRESDEGDSTRRRRKCHGCDKRFTTYERVELAMPSIIKRGGGRADYDVILVYDVSRWGRFQDADESAYYEYICKRAGIQVAYCAEQFENDGSPVSTIVKGVKRAMAGEYSRELSTKVFAGQCRLIELGYRQGGPAGYGLRRQLIDGAGARKGELARGEGGQAGLAAVHAHAQHAAVHPR